MHRGEPLEQVADRIGERLVGEVLVGEERVAATGRVHDHLQDRRHGRRGAEGDVGVPELGPAADGVEHDDLGMVVVALRDVGVDLGRAETATERDVRVGVE